MKNSKKYGDYASNSGKQNANNNAWNNCYTTYDVGDLEEEREQKEGALEKKFPVYANNRSKALSTAQGALEKKFPVYVNQQSCVRARGGKGQRWHLSARGVDLFFAWIPEGAFEMRDGATTRRVEITRGFWMMETPTTAEAFEAFTQTTGFVCMKGAYGYDEETKTVTFDERYSYKNPGFYDFILSANFPATCVDWSSATAFCDWLTDEFSRCNESEGGNGGERLCFRLPTEAEWEWACRGGLDDEPYGFKGGAPELPKHGNFNDKKSDLGDDGYDLLSPTRKYRPNGYQLYDMHGNVWEWCSDWYAPFSQQETPSMKELSENSGCLCWWKQDAASSLPELEKDPTGPASGAERIVRGGAWNSSPEDCETGARGAARPYRRDVRIGFRVVLTVAPK